MSLTTPRTINHQTCMVLTSYHHFLPNFYQFPAVCIGKLGKPQTSLCYFCRSNGKTSHVLETTRERHRIRNYVKRRNMGMEDKGEEKIADGTNCKRLDTRTEEERCPSKSNAFSGEGSSDTNSLHQCHLDEPKLSPYRPYDPKR